jgi:hypothetical protein
MDLIFAGFRPRVKRISSETTFHILLPLRYDTTHFSAAIYRFLFEKCAKETLPLSGGDHNFRSSPLLLPG